MLGDLISQDMFGCRENKRNWKKVENYIKRRNLESFIIRKKIKKFLNESIPFLFIGQGQVDSWHHLRGLLEIFFIKEFGENTFSHEPQQFRTMVRSGGSISIIFVFLEHFAWLYENFAWSCEIASHFSLSMLQPKPILFHFAWSCEIEKHVFSTPLCYFSHFFIYNPPLPPLIQLQSLVQTNYITSFIVHVDHHQLWHKFIKIIPWNDSKTS